MKKPFVLNSHRRLVFPCNFFAELDFSVIDTEEHLNQVVVRDIEAKAPTGEDILAKTSSGKYTSRYKLLRDIALNLFWANRYAMTMYEKRPVRWRDVPRTRDDVYLPILTPWRAGEQKVKAVEAAYSALPPAWDADVEDRIYEILFDVYRNKLHHATELSAVKRTAGEVAADPTNLVYCLSSHDPEPFGRLMERVTAAYPGLRVVATTLRNARTASRNDWGAAAWAEGQLHVAVTRPDLEILDRVGGGDSFASGLIYGLLDGKDLQTAVEYGAAHGALAMTTPGDTTMATRAQVSMSRKPTLWVMALCSGSTKPIKAPPKLMAGAVLPSRTSFSSS